MCLDGLCFLLFSDDLPLPATHTHPHATRSLPHATAVVGVGVGAWRVASGGVRRHGVRVGARRGACVDQRGRQGSMEEGTRDRREELVKVGELLGRRDLNWTWV